MQPWRVLLASERGAAHEQTGQPCQDAGQAARWTTPAGEVMALAVSDGAGSAIYSDVGSKLACACALAWLQAQPEPQTLTEQSGLELVQHLKAQLEQEAEELGVLPRQLACTLSLLLLGEGWSWSLQVGDGAIVYEQPSGELEVMFWPDNGEYANQTYFVDSTPDEMVRCKRLDWMPAAVALMTDGLTSLALHWQERRAHAPFFAPFFVGLRQPKIWNEAQQGTLHAALRAFLTSAAVAQRSNDDKTLALACLTDSV